MIKTICLVFLVAACSSKKTEWDTGASRERAFIEEGNAERAESTQLQFPKTAVPNATRTPSQ